MQREQTWHEWFIPELARLIGCHTYLELGVYDSVTIRKVRCQVRVGVDRNVVGQREPGIIYYDMETVDFIVDKARLHAPYDLVFIDSDHSADAVMADFS